MLNRKAPRKPHIHLLPLLALLRLPEHLHKRLLNPLSQPLKKRNPNTLLHHIINPKCPRSTHNALLPLSPAPTQLQHRNAERRPANIKRDVAPRLRAGRQHMAIAGEHTRRVLAQRDRVLRLQSLSEAAQAWRVERREEGLDLGGVEGGGGGGERGAQGPQERGEEGVHALRAAEERAQRREERGVESHYCGADAVGEGCGGLWGGRGGHGGIGI